MIKVYLATPCCEELNLASLSLASEKLLGGKEKGFGGTNGIIVSDRPEFFVIAISAMQITLSIGNIRSPAPAAIHRLDSII
jgi:hypothetical protein